MTKEEIEKYSKTMISELQQSINLLVKNGVDIYHYSLYFSVIDLMKLLDYIKGLQQEKEQKTI